MTRKSGHVEEWRKGEAATEVRREVEMWRKMEMWKEVELKERD